MEGITFRGSKGGKIVQSAFKRGVLGADEVLVKVTHSGLCGTDLHYLESDMVLGHEGVGIVQAVGSDCKEFNVGDRVGWGYIHETCSSCAQCTTGHEQFCPNSKGYGWANLDQGSFSNLAVWREQWLFRVPDNLSSEHAAPLMCGGATVFVPLIEYAKPLDRVGIVGIGGLGHLAIQFAAKMGCDVVVFSGTDSKRQEALSLGAREFYATKGVEDYTNLGVTKPIDRLILTTSSLEDVGKYYKLLSQQATIIPLTVSNANMVIPHQPTMLRGIQIVGTVVSGRYLHKKMLEFAERNNVHPIIEKYPMSMEGITEAVNRLQEGKTRYRGVLSWDLV
ncbi:nadp-dependent alcohol dehydrogenase [Moniliophthora roreri MCA 2997]|uniref:Nadp-dependent alcohol dehydrogenase n=2 Tax=Moniliophthora roreri TaxID=221103 RepID=V2XCB5_MONRO|nr:nadp-dependent alcohol dehydrogenase [Moniliophthora roreri MCA 2997]KAI3598118.1 nadp-dependent alcohol dehydrogenase [Moniliophthora roreri]